MGNSSEEAEKRVEEFLDNLKKLDSDMFYYQRDLILSSRLIEKGIIDPALALRLHKSQIKRYHGMTAPFQGLNVGDAENMSYDKLVKITNNFSEENLIGKVNCGRLFRGFMDDGERVHEVTVKTWDFVFPSPGGCADYPRRLHDEIVLLERSELKSHPYFVKLIGFCFEKKLAVVYDLKFKRFLCNSLSLAEFGWEERMKVATNYVLLLKTLSERQVICHSSDIMIDEQYNIKMVNFTVTKHGTRNGAEVSDPTLMKKHGVFEFGILLLELMTKVVRRWVDIGDLESFIYKKGSFVVDETMVDAETGSEITQLINSCLQCERPECPEIDCVFNNLVKIAGYRPVLSDSYPRIQALD